MRELSSILSRLGFGSRPKSENLEDLRDISDDVIESDFVPYACLADPSSIFTKNGEILQIIRIPASAAAETGDLRKALREALFKAIPDTSYAIWIHTIRRRQNLSLKADFQDGFSRAIDEGWNKSQHWNETFTNDLYLSIVKAGQPANLTDITSIRHSFWPKRDAEIRNGYLDAASQELTATVDAILEHLNTFKAMRLQVVPRDGVNYSEQLEFLESLINLESRPMPIIEQDLSQYLTSGEITFGFNAMEVRTAEGKRRFAAIMTIKEYKESSLAAIDQFLTIPCELIVTQSFDFIGAEEAKKSFEKQERFLKLGGDKELLNWSEIAHRIEHKDSPEKAYGQQQCTLFLIAPNMKTLDANIKLVRKALMRIGVVAYREDLRFEQMYWAQLPANFPFIARNRSVNAKHLGGFASLKGCTTTTVIEGPWGSPVALFSNTSGTPYYFHFHRQGVGHTSIIAPPHAGRTTLTHFLLAQAQRLRPRLWYLDTRGRAQSFIHALGGEYQRPGTLATPLNPLKLKDSPANREFLTLWLATLLDPEGKQLSSGLLNFFDQILAGLLPLAPERRSLTVLREILKESDPVLANQMNAWVQGGAQGNLFDGLGDNFAAANIQGWDLSHAMATRTTRNSLAGYLFHRLTMTLDGQPTILVLDEGFQLLDDLLFGPRAATWLDYLRRMNCMVVILTGQPETSAMLRHTPTIQAAMMNQFFLPVAHPGDFYRDRLGLSEDHRNLLSDLHPKDRTVLLTQGEHSEWLTFNLAGITPSLRDTLAGQITTELDAVQMLAATLDHSRRREAV
jgi:type IV secretion system protein VirB4